MTHICIGKLTTIGSDSGLSLGWRQSIIWTNAGILLTGLLGANFSEILIGIQTFSFNKMHLKVSSAKRYPFCLGLNVLIHMWHSSLSMMYRKVSCKRPIRMHFRDEAPAHRERKVSGVSCIHRWVDWSAMLYRLSSCSAVAYGGNRSWLGMKITNVKGLLI